MPQPDIEYMFANLSASGYRVTSLATPAYNCAAWATGETVRCWDPDPGGGNYWPAQVSRVLSLPNLIAALATLGYGPCATSDAEPGFEKLALYADAQSEPTHVARQLPSGVWTSKLGTGEDIEHLSLAGLEEPIYGWVAQFLRRPLPVLP